jgi:chitin synthase
MVVICDATGIIPSTFHRVAGHMKRPDIQRAWQERVTISILVLLFNGINLFYLVEFGRLICPNRDKVWDSAQVAQHQGNTEFWVSVQGPINDIFKFVHGDPSDIVGEASDTQDTLNVLARQDMTSNFPPPLTLARPGLVTDNTLSLQYKNFTPLALTAMHNSVGTQAAKSMALVGTRRPFSRKSSTSTRVR